MDYYHVLQIRRDADDGMIRSAFRRLARQYHPDAGSGSSSEKFQEIARAYETLIDPARRAAYDRAVAARAVPIPIRVEPLAERRAVTQRSFRRTETVGPPFPWSPSSALDLLMSDMFRALQQDLDLLFDGPFFR
jgi:curved DNA-binding protein CbpA